MNDSSQNANQNSSRAGFPFADFANTDIANEMASIVDRLQHWTVKIEDGYGGSGSGVIWNDLGLIVSNAHVVRSNRATVTLSNQRVLDAVAIAREPSLDLAALQLSQTEDLPHAIVANSDNLRVGELVLAVGNPLGMVGALNTGIVTSADRAINSSHIHGSGYVSMEQPSWILSDVQLAPGNSGGLLADARGRVIGINTMIVNGLALAIPSNTVEKFLLSLNIREGDRLHLFQRSVARSAHRSTCRSANRYRNNTTSGFVRQIWFAS
ncbi:S1C family serine protease [Pseudanabaena sp. PCC 6802]|uniref:S1C family serine protease n=1 Tax=Pseudanabaena sp. PCC 6802 TaxID=118173 RepID=UPI00034749EC|nr:trypsin-like peptidase domain-containing protein [Pseudanabaena sp. PCC 6802]